MPERVDRIEVVIEPIHYGVGVRTFASDESLLAGDPDEDIAAVTTHASFEKAIGYWQDRGWGQPRVVDDAYGRYRVNLRRRPAS